MNPLKMLSRGGAVSAPSDADFENVTLLLHGDGTNGAQNNTFLDSSTNNFTITRNGNATQGTFSPFSKPDGRWGMNFNGTDQALSIANNAAFDLSSGSWTIEFWAYIIGGSGYRTFISKRGATTAEWELGVDPSGYFYFYTSTVYADTTVIPTNQWVHLAATYDGSNLRLFQNGVVTRTQASLTAGSGSAPVNIAHAYNGGGQLLPAYLSNVRVVKGTAVYTSAFTPSTTPLTAIANTSLLTCQSNRIVDNSTNAFSFTIYGSPKVTTFSPFPTLTAYDAATNGGSGYFDGSGDFLTAPSNAAFQFGSGAFTMELSLYAASASFGNRTFLQYGLATVTGWTELSWGFGTDASGNPFFEVSNGVNNPQFAITSSVALTAFSWNHIAIVRSGNDFTLYLNGTSVGTTNSSFSLYDPGASSLFHIGRAHNNATSRDWPGYISNLRVVKGTAVYTSAFTPPTAPLTAIANTSLLCNFTNAGIIDNSMSNNLETVGNAQIDTTTKKYGTGSMEFDGTGDYLVMAGNAENFAFGTGDFTIEMWVYVNSLPGTDMLLYDGRPSNGAYPCIILQGSTNKVIWYVNTGVQITATNVAPTTTWFHLAIARSGTSTKMFVDGTQSGSTYTDSTNYLGSASRPYIGANAINGTESFNGFIDDLRITKGKARYTSNFTPPTAAFEDIGE